MVVLGDLSRYRDIEVLGSGGMATVVLAEDTLLRRQVALKRMTAQSDVQGLTRLRREALIGASVSHPNLVSIYDIVIGEDGGIVIVMEYVKGETLRDALTGQEKLPLEEALRILTGVAAGLDTIHKRGIVHRDVKPANVLLGADGTVKLADLGIAAVPDGTRITTAGGMLGSFSYMAPEQLEDSPATPAIDVYSLAVVAFEVLSGRRARREPNPLALARAIATHPPPDIRDAWAAAPPAAAKLLVRAMSSDPRTRPTSASDLVRRLGAALEPHNTVPIATSRRADPARPQPNPAAAARIAAARGSQRPSRERPGGAAAAIAAGSEEPKTPSTDPAVEAGEDQGTPPSRPVPLAASDASVAAAPPVYRVHRRWPRAVVPLALVAAAVILVVLLATSGSSPRKRSVATPNAGSPPTNGRSTAAGATGTSSGTGGRAASASSGSAAGAQSGSSSTRYGTAIATTNPVSAVESFYSLAASHRYADAWSLADPTFRSQLGGFASFEAGQAADRSITFNNAHVVNRASSSATVAVRTTSVRTVGTEYCRGTVDLRPGASSSSWLLHLIHIQCI